MTTQPNVVRRITARREWTREDWRRWGVVRRIKELGRRLS